MYLTLQLTPGRFKSTVGPSLCKDKRKQKSVMIKKHKKVWGIKDKVIYKIHKRERKKERS